MKILKILSLCLILSCMFVSQSFANGSVTMTSDIIIITVVDINNKPIQDVNVHLLYQTKNASSVEDLVMLCPTLPTQAHITDVNGKIQIEHLHLSAQKVQVVLIKNGIKENIDVNISDPVNSRTIINVTSSRL